MRPAVFAVVVLSGMTLAVPGALEPVLRRPSAQVPELEPSLSTFTDLDSTFDLEPLDPRFARDGAPVVPEVTTPGPLEIPRPQPQARRHSLDAILEAIREVETGGEKHGGRRATGDRGRSIGPYQVQRRHWIDSRLPGRFEDCRDPDYGRRELIAYWQRWCPAALEQCDAEVLARVHNGGPDGAREPCTLAFWSKVRKVLERRAS